MELDWSDIAFDELKAQQVRLIAYVPDKILSHLIERLEADPFFRVVPVTREEEGVGVVVGGYLGGVRGALLCQNSGIGNSLGALASVVVPYQIPMLLVISHRGDLGDFNGTQIPMGRALRPVLDSVGLCHFTPYRLEEVRPTIQGAIGMAFAGHQPVAVIIPTLLSGGKTHG
ncbi:MAG: decarboxylase [Chloroflexi bacterium]|nr:decarboxylase [Chloroflexota bacterium]